MTAVSHWLGEQISASPIFADKPLHVVHNSVDATHFSPGNLKDARRALQIPDDCFAVLLAGQSIEGVHRGIAQHAVCALNQLQDQKIHTILVGRSAAKVAATLTTPSTLVSFRETPAAMAQCYRAANLTIVPSEYETFGRIAAESLFCGTPVVAFATGGLPEIIDDPVCGRTVTTGDVPALAAAITELKLQPEKLQQMSHLCVEHARKRFDTQPITNAYLDVYRQAICSRASC